MTVETKDPLAPDRPLADRTAEAEARKPLETVRFSIEDYPGSEHAAKATMLDERDEPTAQLLTADELQRIEHWAHYARRRALARAGGSKGQAWHLVTGADGKKRKDWAGKVAVR